MADEFKSSHADVNTERKGSLLSVSAGVTVSPRVSATLAAAACKTLRRGKFSVS